MDVLLQFVKAPIVIGTVILLQIIKYLLDKKNIRFKDQDDWLWVTLGMGIPMAALAQGLDGWASFNVSGFIINIILYAAIASLAYKVYKVGGKKIGNILSGDDKGTY